MMKLRKNMLIAMMAGLLAFAGTACDDGTEEEPTDVEVEEPGLDEPIEEEPAES